MSEISNVNNSPVLVSIFGFQYYVDKFKISSSANAYEKATVSGKTVATNKNVNSNLITLEGRFIADDYAMRFIDCIDSQLRNKTAITLKYNILVFLKCTIKSYSAEIDSKGVMNFTLNLLCDNVNQEGLL